MKNVLTFIKKEIALVMLLLFFLVNPFGFGLYAVYFLLLLLIAKNRFSFQYFDKYAVAISLYSVLYGIFYIFELEQGVQYIFYHMFFPITFYMTGKYISSKYNSSDILVFILFSLAFFLSVIPIVSVLMDIKVNGFIGGGRSMTLLWDDGQELSATKMGSLFSLTAASIGLITIKKANNLEKTITTIVVICFLLAVVCILRIGSRTQLGVAIISLTVAFFANFKKQSYKRKIALVAIFVGITAFVVSKFDLDADWYHFYASRYDNEYGVATAGGRTAKWTGSIEKTIESPFGWKDDTINYAHNLWLDVARVGSILPFFVITYFTIIIIPLFIRVFRHLNKKSLFLQTYLLLFFLCFYMQFFVEPVVEGMFSLFLIFFLFIGLLSGIDNLHKAETKQPPIINK